MLRLLRVLSLIGLFLLPLWGCKEAHVFRDPRVRVELLTDQESINPGSRFTLGVRFVPEPGWHVYWKNPGDSGLPPRFGWKTSRFISVGEALWPTPERIQTGPLVNYGYGEVLLPFPATFAGDSIVGGQEQIELYVQWLVCKDECVPGEATLRLSLQSSREPGGPSKSSGLFQRAFETVPAPLTRTSIAVEEQENKIIIALIPLEPRTFPTDVTFFPEERQVILNAEPQWTAFENNTLRITLAKDPMRREPVEGIRGVLFSPSGWSPSGIPKSVSIDTSSTTVAEGVKETATVQPPPDPTQSKDAPGVTTSAATPLLQEALLLAFIGGLILNIMPCVFPVLSIKILGFIEHAHGKRSVLRMHGTLFSLGVLVSFWILAGILAGSKMAGDVLGWGFQLQSPSFVVGMIFVLFSLGVLFLSDVTIGSRVQSAAGKLSLSNSLAGSFFNGVLATAVATPCTAPFMGSALAAAATFAPLESFCVFTALGLGMSAPYLVLTIFPQLLAFLPKPGAWMESFKQAMAFPLFASVVWLLGVFGKQMGVHSNQLAAFMALLWGVLALSFGLWLFGRGEKMRSSLGRLSLRASGAVTVLFGVYVALPGMVAPVPPPSVECGGADQGDVDSFGLRWFPYSDARLQSLMSEHKNILLDFTAEWCITCKVNEGVVFRSERVRELIAQKGVVLVRADWTAKNPEITNALKRFGRTGVPLNVIVPEGDQKRLVVLPNILTPGIVISELEKLP